MAEPATPVITFRVDLTTVNTMGHLSPNAYGPGDLGRTYDATFATTRHAYFPGLLCGENREMQHNGTFQVAGMKADYYRREIAKGNFPFLKVQSIDA